MPTATMDPVIVRLEKAPRAEWAKHRSRARTDLRCLLHSWLLTGKWYYFFLLLSETGRLLAREKYSAFAIDRVYANDPAGFGWLGRRLDRYLLDLPVHRAVRDRFAFVTRNLAMAIESRLDSGLAAVSVVSVPCGLVRDLCTVYASLRLRHADVGQRLKFYGLDLDFEGRVLDEAQRRAQAADVPIQLVQSNALDESTWWWLHEQEGSLSVVNCIGLTPWLSPEELKSLLRRFAESLCDGGYVLLDRFNRGRHSRLGEEAQIHACYHTNENCLDYIRGSGLTVQSCEMLGDGEGIGYLLRKLPTACARRNWSSSSASTRPCVPSPAKMEGCTIEESLTGSPAWNSTETT